MSSSNTKAFITKGLIFNIFLFFGSVNLYLNDRLRAEYKKKLENGEFQEYKKKIHSLTSKKYDYKYGRIEVRNKINSYRKKLTSYATGKILETGCGTGRNFTFYKENDDVTAIDYSPEMILYANKKYNQEDNEDGTINIVNCRNIKIKEMDLYEIDKYYEKDSFDTIIDFMNMEAYFDPSLALKKMKSVLKDGGKLILICRGQSSNRLISEFYNIFKYSTIMRFGVEYNTDWNEFFSKDDELNCLYKERKNWGKTYLYIFEYKRKDIENKV